jgi:S-adenosylmethionine hydrolase
MAVIALLTDFGTRDYYVGAMKGVILSVAPSAVIVDITHEVPPQDIREAAYTLRACYRDFPAGTVFVAVVDPGVGSGRQALAVESGGYYFLAPDNGLLNFVLDDARIFELTNKRFFRGPVSNTFHGRDIFAPVAVHLSLGVKIEKLGPPVSDPVRLVEGKPAISENGIEGEIIHIDRFGNIVTNILGADLPTAYRVELGGAVIEDHRRFYAEAGKDEVFSIIGSVGFLEISVRDSSARDTLQVRIGQRVYVTRA